MSIEFKKAVLDTGMTIIAETDSQAHSAAAGFFVKAGARDEATKIMGVSHYLEHMMFKGTEELTAEAINQGFDDLGASNNAYTSREMTCFYAHVIPENISSATELLSKMMRPALRADDFDTEKQVILEEIAMYQDNPFWKLYEEATARHYGSHTLSHRVLGTKESVTDLTRDQMAEYFNERYAADKTVVALAGNLDFDKSVAQIDALCKEWQRSVGQRDITIPPVSPSEFTMKDEQVSRGYLIGIAQAPSSNDDQRYAAALLAQILGGVDNSKLHWALIETGIAEEAQAGYDGLDGTGDYYLYASGDPEKLDDIWAVILKEIHSLKDTITEDDLVGLRSKMATAATIGSERPGDRMQRLGRLWTMTGEYLPLDEELAKIGAVTVDDLKAVCDAYPLDHCTLGRMVPSDQNN
ncbi:MAG: insulinase family protein [Phycisphaerales bacterium]|nr:insulinase family protein [Phycisphaerales bacterium]